MITSRLKALSLVIPVLLLSACFDGDASNLQDYDDCEICENWQDIDILFFAGNLYVNWYTNTYGYALNQASPVHMLSIAADNITSSWGDAAAMDTSTEPRNEWNNTVSYTYESVTSDFYYNMYEVLSGATEILLAMDGEATFGSNNEMIESWSKFIQGIALANIALTFDQGYIITEDTPVDEVADPILYPAAEIQTKALSLFDEAIAIAEANTFALPNDFFNGVSADNIYLVQIANSYAARLLAYMPRTTAQNSDVDWERVKAYSQQGIDQDFEILMDDIVWRNDFKWVIASPGWGRVDMRVANMMYPEVYPSHNADGLDFPVPDSETVLSAANIDNRILSDFEHLSSNNFRPERGLYHFSSFRHSRYDDYLTQWTTQLPELLVDEITLIEAEAELELGNLAAAAAILNNENSARKTRGGLPDVMVEESAIRDAISHERHVELMGTSFGLQFFDMRKQDLLQAGTFLELPLPAKVQELLGYETPYYTFGGDNEVSTSVGGWR